jgi:chemotaxis protein MotB
LESNREKKNVGPKIGDNVIQVMTISLFIILLAFFILLNSIAVLNEQKVFAAIGSLLGNFGIKTGGYSVLESIGEKYKFSPAETGKSPIDFSDLFKDGGPFSREIMILSTPRGSIVRISADQLFEKSEIKIKSSGYEILRRLTGIIKKNKYPVEISGHTDNVPIEVGGISKRELSVIQALHVLKYFIEIEKIPPDRLTALGWGEYRNAFSNQTRETRELNRRIDIIFLHKKMKQKPAGGFIFKNFFFKTFE